MIVSLDTLVLSASLKASLQEATQRYAQEVDSLGSYLEPRGVSHRAATGHLLGRVSDPIPGHEKFLGMMSIPYLTPAGTVAMKFRRIDGSEGPKYDSPPGQKARLYNVMDLLEPAEVVAICEGELAALVFSDTLGIPTVGTPGTQWMEHWSRCFADYDRVLVVADHDVKDDGSSPGVKHAKAVVSKVPHAELVLPPAGEDPDSWIVNYGADAVRERLGI